LVSKVLIAGSIGLDDVSTPFGSVKNVPGGSAIYASLACSIFSKTAMIGTIGNDFPKDKLDLFEEKGIDVSAVGVSQKPTMKWKAHYGLDINVAHTDSFEANSLLDLPKTVPSEFASADYFFAGNFDPENQLSLLRSLKKKPKLSVCDTMDYYINSKREKVLEMVNAADIALMNDSEARALFKTTNLVRAAQEILKLNSDYAIIKKGEHGCVMFSKSTHFSCIGYPLENIKDPTGCGDSFAGALIGYLASTADLSEKNMRKAIVVASAVASFNAESFSFYKLAEISKKDVMNRVKEIKEIVKFK
jgi:ribokinase